MTGASWYYINEHNNRWHRAVSGPVSGLHNLLASSGGLCSLASSLASSLKYLSSCNKQANK